MQQSMISFCEECGAALAEDMATCPLCQHPFSVHEETSSAPATPVLVAPTQITPAQVIAGSHSSNGTPGIGTVLAGRYQILKEIGQGGFGSVYRARDLQNGRLVAIKRINLTALPPQEIIEATDTFNREVKLLSTLKHPNIPQFYALFTDANHWYLVMEYIEGQTLEEYLRCSRKGYLPVARAVKMCLALANVLGYLHERRPPVIFRDLKPANIMLTRRGNLYLIDFGIARRFSPEKKKDTGPLGSPGYAAPEQYGRAQTDQRTDLYGLGATLQTALTGREPLELRTGQPSLRTRPLPTSLQNLISSMLAADPAQRPADMAAVAQWCEHFLRSRKNAWSLCKGLLLGSLPLVYYLILGLVGPWPVSYNYTYPILNLILLLDVICHYGSIGGVVLLGFLFHRGKKRWLVGGLLIMMSLLAVLALLHIIPPAYAYLDYCGRGGVSCPHP